MARAEDIRVGVDYGEVARALDDFREILRASVAGLVADGFTEEQARAMTVHMVTLPADRQD